MFGNQQILQVSLGIDTLYTQTIQILPQQRKD